MILSQAKIVLNERDQKNFTSTKLFLHAIPQLLFQERKKPPLMIPAWLQIELMQLAVVLLSPLENLSFPRLDTNKSTKS